MLNTVQFGKADAESPPLLIAHGLYGSARNWTGIARALARDRPVITVDMRNHGASPRAQTQSYADMAADLAEVIAAHGTEADVLGHSMGGKAAMVLALERPDLVNRLIVADIAPVGYSHSQLRYAHAMMAADLSNVSTLRDADRALHADIPDAGTRAFLLQSLDVGARAWRLNLDVLAREMEEIMSFPALDGTFRGRTMFLSGGDSDYVRAEHRDRIKSLFPKAAMVGIPGAGHWLHAEKPREFEAAVSAFLNRG